MWWLGISTSFQSLYEIKTWVSFFLSLPVAVYSCPVIMKHWLNVQCLNSAATCMGKARGWWVQRELKMMVNCSIHHLSGVMIKQRWSDCKYLCSQTRWRNALWGVLFQGYHIKWPGKALPTLKGHTIVRNHPDSQWKTEFKDQSSRVPLDHSRGGFI